MRDDLHHSLPLRTPWRAVVKAAGSPAMHGHLPDLMTRAVWATVGACWDSDWGASFQAVLSAQQQDMFDQERLERSLRSLEATAPDHFARRACEVAHAILMSSEPGADVARQVRSAVFEAALEDGIEAAAARVSQERPGQHAGQLRRKLYSEIHNCNLPERPAPRRRSPKPSVEDGLRTPLAVSF
jgi:hypothetical protein